MISENGLVSSDVYFVSFSVVWTARAWHIKSRSPLYNAPLCRDGYCEDFNGTTLTDSPAIPYFNGTLISSFC